MPLTPLFAASQTIGVPSGINLLDASTGSDADIISRKVGIVDASGNYYTASGITTTVAYTAWAYADSTKTILCMPFDIAPNITVYWLDVNGVTLYSKVILFDFTLYGLQGSFGLTMALSAKPNTIQDANYWMNRMILRCNIDDADNSVEIGGNIFIAQACLDRETYMLSKQSLFF